MLTETYLLAQIASLLQHRLPDGWFVQRESQADLESHLLCAAPTQVVVDLLVSPGRGPEEAEALLEWMADHELEWRRPYP